MSDNLVITPTHGLFDLSTIRGWLDSRPDTFEDPLQPNHYLMNGHPVMASYIHEMMFEGRSGFPTESNVYLAPDQILLNQEYSDASDLRSSMEFLEWLVHHFVCKVKTAGYDVDLTAKIAEHGAGSLYPADVREAPLLWAGELIGVGFFHEVFSGKSFESLRRARRSVGGPNDERLASYLETGHLYRRADDDTQDYFDPNITVGPPHLLTDGVYVWPADLPYYVRTYHVELPRAFVIHVRKNDWQMPRGVDLASLPEFKV